MNVNTRGSIRLNVFDDNRASLSDVAIFWESNLGMDGQVKKTDSDGIVVFADLVPAQYTFIASLPVSSEEQYNAEYSYELHAGENKNIRITMHLNSYGLKINELYFSGVLGETKYQNDQFIELYNNSNDTIYLDNTIIFHSMGGYDLAGGDLDQDGDIDYTYYDPIDSTLHKCIPYVYQLDGSGTDYPIYPHQYKVVAVDAIDHRQQENASIDLSHADFEFTNEYYPRDAQNSVVPNYWNQVLGEHGFSSNKDFMMSLATGIVGIVSNDEKTYWDGIDVQYVIDAVEYSRNSDHVKQSVSEIDNGWAGEGLGSFSGKSIQRIHPGFDTNNSSIDFEILEKPTPGK